MGSDWLRQVEWPEKASLRRQLRLRHEAQEGDGLFSVFGGISGRGNSQSKCSRAGISLACPRHRPKLWRPARRLAATVQARNHCGFDSGRTRSNGQHWTHLGHSLEVES